MVSYSHHFDWDAEAQQRFAEMIAAQFDGGEGCFADVDPVCRGVQQLCHQRTEIRLVTYEHDALELLESSQFLTRCFRLHARGEELGNAHFDAPDLGRGEMSSLLGTSERAGQNHVRHDAIALAEPAYPLRLLDTFLGESSRRVRLSLRDSVGMTKQE